MKDILEILVAMLAVFGGYTVLDMIRVRLLYPKSVRMMLRAAAYWDTYENVARACEYADYLKREQKISPEPLIILTDNDIIKSNEEISRLCEVCTIVCKENENDGNFPHG